MLAGGLKPIDMRAWSHLSGDMITSQYDSALSCSSDPFVGLITPHFGSEELCGKCDYREQVRHILITGVVKDVSATSLH